MTVIDVPVRLLATASLRSRRLAMSGLPKLSAVALLALVSLGCEEQRTAPGLLNVERMRVCTEIGWRYFQSVEACKSTKGSETAWADCEPHADHDLFTIEKFVERDGIGRDACVLRYKMTIFDRSKFVSSELVAVRLITFDGDQR